jgi:transketolase
MRPADADETEVCWRTIIDHGDRPAVLMLSRQELPIFDRRPGCCTSAKGAAKGAYVLAADSVLPPTIRARASVEAAVGQGWREMVGDSGQIVSLEHFGASGDFETLYQGFDLTPEKVADAVRRSLHSALGGPARPGGEQRSGTPRSRGPGDPASV